MLEGEEAREHLMRKYKEDDDSYDTEHRERREERKKQANTNSAIRQAAEEVVKRDGYGRMADAELANRKVNKAYKEKDKAWRAYMDAHGSDLDKARDKKDKTEEAYEKASKEADAARNNMYNASRSADDTDAVERHMRRHPDQWDGSKRIKTRSEACGIFESVEFLND